MGVINFNNQSSEDFHIKVWQPPDYRIPERDYEIIQIPGRNGDLIIDKGSFKNTTRSYIVSIFDCKKSFTALANKLAEWLNSASGYSRLEDSYEPDYYRMALYRKAIDITNVLGKAGYATIEFECKPQRYLKIGDKSVIVTQGLTTTLFNPTTFEADPIIKAFGSSGGEININSNVIRLDAIDTNVVIDCEAMEVYKETEEGNVNWNSYIHLNSEEFPKLIPGLNTISFSGGITSMEVKPKWWTI